MIKGLNKLSVLGAIFISCASYANTITTIINDYSGPLYMYDLSSSKQIHPITKINPNVRYTLTRSPHSPDTYYISKKPLSNVSDADLVLDVNQGVSYIGLNESVGGSETLGVQNNSNIPFSLSCPSYQNNHGDVSNSVTLGKGDAGSGDNPPQCYTISTADSDMMSITFDNTTSINYYLYEKESGNLVLAGIINPNSDNTILYRQASTGGIFYLSEEDIPTNLPVKDVNLKFNFYKSSDNNKEILDTIINSNLNVSLSCANSVSASNYINDTIEIIDGSSSSLPICDTTL
ncbi:hypothetical protein [Piscirickettsia litoralis]|uniref:Uncharacterized protein n=1 Tax=Piscirickettsia litoralis TaxID=1891921 RepID=A0ABX3A1J4_9GAMM|nr:hypothetical protein [Piscirickettsia litoralis]ODN41320.1 hypothetical protein BGC07_17315 [Piscirickettsia litoralis]